MRASQEALNDAIVALLRAGSIADQFVQYLCWLPLLFFRQPRLRTRDLDLPDFFITFFAVVTYG